LDLSKILDTLAGGSAANWSMINYSPRILAENYSPGFFVKHFVKDLKIALDEANNMGIDLPSTTLAEQLYEKLEKAGYGDDGTQALIKLWWQDGKKS
jgi:3-hydroxyisobutyrate dehydrogenase